MGGFEAMATSSGSAGPSPKILLAKPAMARTEGPTSGGTAQTGIKLMRDRDDDNFSRSRMPQGSPNMLSDHWELNPDRYLPVSIFISV